MHRDARMVRTHRWVWPSTLALVLVAACSATPDEVAPQTQELGTLVQTWTIEGTTAPESCAKYGAERVRLVLYNAGPEGLVYGTALEDCRAFELRQLVVAQEYTGVITLIDASGVSVSETLPIPLIEVAPNATQVATIDFSAQAFVP